MKKRTLYRSLRTGATLLCALLATAPSVFAAEGAAEQVDMAEMMKRAKQFTQPGEHHALLERFLGDWDVSTKIVMSGAPAEPGKATFSWLMEGRWLQGRSTGTLMGLPAESFMVLGYDNFKSSYRTMFISSMDTALLTSEGDLDPRGNVLLTYGTLDEYLTGEHDKMVKYVWRFLSDDEILFEIHDLPIGEHNTKVVEMRYKRRPDAPQGESR